MKSNHPFRQSGPLPTYLKIARRYLLNIKPSGSDLLPANVGQPCWKGLSPQPESYYVIADVNTWLAAKIKVRGAE